jgi:hypothetical protein
MEKYLHLEKLKDSDSVMHSDLPKHLEKLKDSDLEIEKARSMHSVKDLVIGMD